MGFLLSWKREFLAGYVFLSWGAILTFANVAYAEISTLGGWALFGLPILLQGIFYIKNHHRFKLLILLATIRTMSQHVEATDPVCMKFTRHREKHKMAAIASRSKNRRTKLGLVFLVISVFARAQDIVPELITDRPDQTESSAVVPLKSLQIETGFMLETDETDLIQETSYAYNTTLLRFGLLENLELRMGLDYLGQKVAIKNTDTTNTISGFSPIYTGFKVKIADEDGWKPEVAFLGGLVLPFTANEKFKPEYTAANIRFAFSHTLSDRFSLGYNLGAEWDGETAIPGYFYSLALGISVSNRLGTFIESYGLIPEEGGSEHLFDAGFTYLVMPNFQLDVSGGIGLNSNAINNFVSLGLTYRLPD